MWTKRLSFSLLLLTGVAVRADAAMVDILPAKDTTIFSDATGNSAGGADGLFVGKNGTGGIRRSLMTFNVAGAIPAGATIQSVELKMTLGLVAGMGTGGGPQSIGLYRLSADWGEGSVGTNNANDILGMSGGGAGASAGDATWAARNFGSANWTTAGGDFTGAARASAMIDNMLGNVYTWSSTAALVSDVQEWLDGPAPNNGWLLKNDAAGDGATNTNFRAFYSRNVSNMALLPLLRVTYVAVPEASGLTLCAAALGLAFTSGRWKRRAGGASA